MAADGNSTTINEPARVATTGEAQTRAQRGKVVVVEKVKYRRPSEICWASHHRARTTEHTALEGTLHLPRPQPVVADASQGSTTRNPQTLERGVDTMRCNGSVPPMPARQTEAASPKCGEGHLLDENAVAARLGLSVRTLRNWRVRGVGPRFIRLSRRAVRYAPADVDAWIAARTVHSTSERERDDDA